MTRFSQSPFGETKGAFLFPPLLVAFLHLTKNLFTPLCLCAGFFLLSSSAFAESFQLKIGKLFAEGRVVEIEEAVAARLEKEPSQLDLWLELADLRKSQGNYAGAVGAYHAYLDHKDDWKVRAALGLALEQMGKFGEGEQILHMLNAEHSDRPAIRWRLARLC